MKFFIKKVKNFLLGRKYTENKDAAEIIRRFVHGTGDQYEWDDFETISENNPDVDLAIELCLFFAGEFPATNKNEYCDKQADPYFLKIAEALENSKFQDLDLEAVKDSLKKNVLPESVSRILGIESIK